MSKSIGGSITISISKDEILTEVEKLFKGKFNAAYLEQCISDEHAYAIDQNKIFIADENGKLTLAEEHSAGN